MLAWRAGVTTYCEQLGDTWARFMGEWLPASGRRMNGGVSYEVYHNTPMDTPNTTPPSLYWPIRDVAVGYTVAVPEKPMMCILAFRIVCARVQRRVGLERRTERAPDWTWPIVTSGDAAMPLGPP